MSKPMGWCEVNADGDVELLVLHIFRQAGERRLAVGPAGYNCLVLPGQSLRDVVVQGVLFMHQYYGGQSVCDADGRLPDANV